jgi:hypothetical protein
MTREQLNRSGPARSRPQQLRHPPTTTPHLSPPHTKTPNILKPPPPSPRNQFIPPSSVQSIPPFSSSLHDSAGAEARSGGEMWVFYMISLPLTVGMVAATLRYFAGPAVPAHVLAVVGYAWLSSLSFVVLVPTDIWTVRLPPAVLLECRVC